MGRPTGGGHRPDIGLGGHRPDVEVSGHRIGEFDSRPVGMGRHNGSYNSGNSDGLSSADLWAIYGLVSWIGRVMGNRKSSGNGNSFKVGGSNKAKKGKLRSGVIICLICAIILSIVSVGYSLVNETPLDTGEKFKMPCVFDAEGWFKNDSDTIGKTLKKFYKDTGIQPYIVTMGYSKSVSDDAVRERYAKDMYKQKYEMKNDPNGLMFMYFAEEDPNEIGYMTLVEGTSTKEVVSKSDVEYFWKLIDANWSASTSEKLFQEVLGDFAKSVFGDKVTQNVLYIFTVLCWLLFLVLELVWVKIKRDEKLKKKEAEEERILNEDVDNLADEIADKYR